MRKVIQVNSVSKDFALPHELHQTLKTRLVQMFKRTRTRSKETQHALRDISFDIKEGEFFGIVGRNGSGKSTLLKILAGIYQPTKGAVSVEGKLVPFIELGVGFNPELTGRENVFLNGALLGFSKKQVDAMYDEIVEFAELGRFMDQKLKNFSSGMQVRLAFSLAIRAKAQILLIDEVLAVGDADFQRKCFDYFRELKRSSTTVIFVSHDMNAVIEYCDRAVLIDNSRLIDEGDPERIAKAYNQLFMDKTPDSVSDGKASRWGDQVAVVANCTPDKKSYRAPKDDVIQIATTIHASQDVDHNISVGFLVKNAAGVSVLGTNTYEKHEKVGKLAKGDQLTVVWHVPNIFGDGAYSIDAAITTTDGSVTHDWQENIASFRVYREETSPYIITPSIPVTISRV